MFVGSTMISIIHRSCSYNIVPFEELSAIIKIEPSSCGLECQSFHYIKGKRLAQIKLVRIIIIIQCILIHFHCSPATSIRSHGRACQPITVRTFHTECRRNGQGSTEKITFTGISCTTIVPFCIGKCQRRIRSKPRLNFIICIDREVQTVIPVVHRISFAAIIA